jgi:hypothetical protein
LLCEKILLGITRPYPTPTGDLFITIEKHYLGSNKKKIHTTGYLYPIRSFSNIYTAHKHCPECAAQIQWKLPPELIISPYL